MTAMDDGELRQLVIGLVTQIYYADRDGKDAYDPEVAAGLTTLVQDLTPAAGVVWAASADS
ncbi:MAG: hypothetical protein JO296_21835 [Pseudonocardiales bacterium]|nr:hypothetical protein [Pseudonocardiales bacterium]MBV9652757.1 hypothetical protein [Pseudonocardiales bacterium]